MQINKTPEVSKSILWEALKAYLHGQIISFSAHQTKTKKEKRQKLIEQISEIDHQYAESSTAELLTKRITLQTEFNLLASDETVKLINRSRHKYYEYGDKIGKYLAHQIRVSETSKLITEIRTGSGCITKDQLEINQEFRFVLYSKLYSTQSVKEVKLLDDFFDNLDIPSINERNKKLLEEPISLEEVRIAIQNLQSSKAPGPDGYTPEFYKMFLADIAPLLIDVFNESLERGLLPATFYQASISLLHKKGKDPFDPASYRPVSLLNVDNKILAKIMTIRLENILPSIIHEDQTGFIKNRQMVHNIRRLFDIIYSSHLRSYLEILISLDAEKAFDRVEWDYLFSALSRFGFGSIFISWIRLLYASPISSVQTNKLRSDYFMLERSTRQGCPLSPMLFALAIEPLAISSGVFRGEGEHKVSLYADDLLLYISNPSKSIPAITSTLKKFGQISEYKLNMGKSILFPINNLADQQSFETLPIKTLTEFKYLGINVTKIFVDLYKENFSKLLDQITQDLQRWSHIAISLAGKNNIIKMNILPFFLFLFQCIPSRRVFFSIFLIKLFQNLFGIGRFLE